MADTTTTNFALTKPEIGASSDTWGTKWNANLDDIDALSRGYYTSGGTADAITVTTGLSLAAIPTGFRVRFLASANNTGATTINVDGLGATAAQTIRGTALTADYIISGNVITAEYTGSAWRVYRIPDTGTTGGSGQYDRLDSGLMICRNNLLVTSGGMATWTFPKAFSSAPVVTGNARDSAVIIITMGAPTTTTVDVYSQFPGGLPATGTVHVTAIGRWYS